MNVSRVMQKSQNILHEEEYLLNLNVEIVDVIDSLIRQLVCQTFFDSVPDRMSELFQQDFQVFLHFDNKRVMVEIGEHLSVARLLLMVVLVAYIPNLGYADQQCLSVNYNTNLFVHFVDYN
jgi:hypothetical protein